jgi:hypothetical protein
MTPIEVESIAVLRYFDKIMHKMSLLHHNIVSAKEFSEMFASADGIDIISRLPENTGALTFFLNCDIKRSLELCEL